MGSEFQAIPARSLDEARQALTRVLPRAIILDILLGGAGQLELPRRGQGRSRPPPGPDHRRDHGRGSGEGVRPRRRRVRREAGRARVAPARAPPPGAGHSRPAPASWSSTTTRSSATWSASASRTSRSRRRPPARRDSTRPAGRRRTSSSWTSRCRACRATDVLARARRRCRHPGDPGRRPDRAELDDLERRSSGGARRRRGLQGHARARRARERFDRDAGPPGAGVEVHAMPDADPVTLLNVDDYAPGLYARSRALASGRLHRARGVDRDGGAASRRRAQARPGLARRQHAGHERAGGLPPAQERPRHLLGPRVARLGDGHHRRGPAAGARVRGGHVSDRAGGDGRADRDRPGAAPAARGRDGAPGAGAPVPGHPRSHARDPLHEGRRRPVSPREPRVRAAQRPFGGRPEGAARRRAVRSGHRRQALGGARAGSPRDPAGHRVRGAARPGTAGPRLPSDQVPGVRLGAAALRRLHHRHGHHAAQAGRPGVPGPPGPRAGRPARRGERQPDEGRLPGHAVARAPDAHRRHPRVGPGAHHRSARRGDPPSRAGEHRAERASASPADRRPPGSLSHHRGQAAARPARGRSGSGADRRHRDRAPGGPGEGDPDRQLPRDRHRHRHGRFRAAPAGVLEPPVERGEVHAPRRPGGSPSRARGLARAGPGQRQRRGHPQGDDLRDLRSVPAGRQHDDPHARRAGARPGHRPEPRGAPGRHGLGLELRGRRGRDVHGDAPGRPDPDHQAGGGRPTSSGRTKARAATASAC